MTRFMRSDKVAILGDAARYDAFCAFSGTTRHVGRDGKGAGSTEGSGICHSLAPDGHYISLLKLLITNFCIYDCAYCINRVSSHVTRARLSVDKVVQLMVEFYRRNYNERLFLSSGIIRSPDATMEAMVQIAKRSHEQEGCRSYLHLKTIPDAAPELIEQVVLITVRLFINIELPTDHAVKVYAPEKNPETIRSTMDDVKTRRAAAGERSYRRKRGLKFVSAGQSTQMIVGAVGATDATILGQLTRLYGDRGLRQINYAAFTLTPDASAALRLIKPSRVREHRLCQADWLLRFYGYASRHRRNSCN